MPRSKQHCGFGVVRLSGSVCLRLVVLVALAACRKWFDDEYLGILAVPVLRLAHLHCTCLHFVSRVKRAEHSEWIVDIIVPRARYGYVWSGSRSRLTRRMMHAGSLF